MRYFTVLAADDAQRTLLEIDIPARELRLLFESVEGRLKENGFFTLDDVLLKRLTPLYDSDVEAISVQLLDESPEDIGSLPYDVYPSLPNAAADSPALQGLSLCYFSQSEQKAVIVNFPVQTLFRPAQEYLAQKVINRKLASSHASFSISVFLRGQGPLFTYQTYSPRSALLIINLRTQDMEEEMWQPVELTVTERTSLIVPQGRSWHHYDSKFIGVRQRGDLRVLMKRKAYNELWKHVRIMKDKFEIGGFLVGELYKDENDQLFIDISKVMPTNLTESGYFTVGIRVTPGVTQELFGKIKEQYPELKRIGWYHAHLHDPLPGTDLVNTRYEIHRVDPYFSNLDKELHRNLFPEPWQVALVILADGKKRQLAFYQWKKGKIESCNGFYVYD